MIDMIELSVEEMNEIDGGWNLLEYVAKGIGYVVSWPIHHQAGQESISVYTNGIPWP